MTISEMNFGWTQNIGASTPHELQQDRVRVDYVRTKAWGKILLAIVADGENHPDAGHAAQRVIDKIFRFVKKAENEPLDLSLERALVSAADAIKEDGAQVAATVVAISENKLYISNVGHAVTLLLRDGKTLPIAHPSANLLGGIHSERSRVIDLKPGDHIVLSSDGLLRTSPEDGKPFVDPAHIPEYVQGNSPTEATLHLVSLAMGRNVDDNVSVAVLEVLQSKKRLVPFVTFLGVLGFLTGLVLFIRSQQDALPLQRTDYGYAVLVEGSALLDTEDGGTLALGSLETISPGAPISIHETSKMVLQSSRGNEGGLLSATFFLAAGSKLALHQIDIANSSREDSAIDRAETILELVTGKILIIRTSGVWVFSIVTVDGQASLENVGLGVIAVEASASGTVLDCFEGNCTFATTDGDDLSLRSGQRVSLIGTEISTIEEIPPSRNAAWNALCSDCF